MPTQAPPRKTPNKQAYLFLVVLALLTARHLGTWAALSAAIILSLPLMDGLLLILSWFTLQYHQTLSTEHPHKGDVVQWTMVISNPLPLTTCPLSIVLYPEPGGRGNPGPGAMGGLRPRESGSFQAVLPCRYRGVYDMGLKSIRFTSNLGFWSLHRQVKPRVMYVEPKIYPIRHTLTDPGASTDLPDRAAPGQSSLPDQVIGLGPYIPGISPARVDWKSSARIGSPVIREYDSATRTTSLVFLDTRASLGTPRLQADTPATAGPSRSPQATGVPPEAQRQIQEETPPGGSTVPDEDCAVEVFFSIISAIRGSWICQVPGWESGSGTKHSASLPGRRLASSPSPGDDGSIAGLSRRSVGIFFSQHYSLVTAVQEHLARNRITRVLLITKNTDGAIIETSRTLGASGVTHRIYCCGREQNPDYRSLQHLVSGDPTLEGLIGFIQDPREIPEKVLL
ncbi:hypothetical protein DC28_06755 [Spirochaeta lutea]|uniref:Uncharacterized protein n=2 Tax=Spirochaeta lutea TaxID=1480694 RepID=A0A098QYX5_9SPIO|nr:hypothetical protein DC28_06755 [Spirochaeta lutea]